MTEAAPGAEFQFIAHLPEWGLEFPIVNATWGGSLPTIIRATGTTVWGAVYKLSDPDLKSLDEIESAEQRSSHVVEAMDRSGKRHQVIAPLVDSSPSTNGSGSGKPSSDHLQLMVAGSRHWSLPVGWIAGLEEHLEIGP